MLLQQHRRPMQRSLLTHVSPRLGYKAEPAANEIHVPLSCLDCTASPQLDRRADFGEATTNGQRQNQNASSVQELHETSLPPFSQSSYQSMYTRMCGLLSAGRARSQELLHGLVELLLLEGFRDVAIHPMLCAFLVSGLDNIGGHCQDRQMPFGLLGYTVCF